MEIPTQLKTLYKHWEKHTIAPEITAGAISFDEDIFTEIERFISERMKVWENKTSGQSLPFTSDPILQKFRFCNIYRELDRQTIEIHQRFSHINDLDTWLLNVAFARYICNTATVSNVGLLEFDDTVLQNARRKLKTLPSPKYGTAYVFPISTIMKSEFNSREKFFTLYLGNVIPRISKLIRDFKNISVVDALSVILPVLGFNHKFHWTEILIDLGYRYPDYIDLYKRFPIGPGSRPTFEKLDIKLDPEIACMNMISFLPEDFPYLDFNGKTVFLSAENWEGIGCEFRKYSNLSKGIGRKRLYKI